MKRTKEQSEATAKLKEIQQEQSILSERSMYLAGLLRQQWENYRKHRYHEDLMLLITILQDANLVKERLDKLSHSKTEYEAQVKYRSIKPSTKATLIQTIKIYLIYTAVGIILYLLAGMPVFDSIF